MSDNKVEYVLSQGKVLPPYIMDKDAEQNRYFWRNENSFEYNPVTVPELMNALKSAIPNKKSRAKLKELVESMMSEVTERKNGEDSSNVSIVSREINGIHYPLSPSSIQTIMSVLTVIHDSGIDYDFVSSKEGTIELKIKDNLGSNVRLIDTVNPHLIGQVSGRGEKYWAPDLSLLTFSKEAGYENKKDKSMDDFAVLQEVYPSGKLASIYRDKAKKKTLVSHDKRLTSLNLYMIGKNDKTEAAFYNTNNIARARYMGLDQETKDTIALAGVVNALGLNVNTLSDYYRDILADSKINSRYSLPNTTDKRFKADFDFGKRIVNLHPVQNVSANGGELITTPVKDVDNNGNDVTGSIIIDLRSAVVAENRLGVGSDNPKMNPNQLSEQESLACIHVAYRDARVNYLKMLTGSSQENVNKQAFKDQKKFTRILENTVKDDVLSENGVSIEKEMRAPLDVKSQEAILIALKNSFLLSEATVDGVEDSNLASERVKLITDVNDPIVRVRRLEVFDELVTLFNNRLGNAPLINTLAVSDSQQLTPNEYKKQLEKTLSNYNADTLNEKLSEFDDTSNQLVDLVVNSLDNEDSYMSKDEIIDVVKSMTYSDMRSQLSSDTQDSFDAIFDKLNNEMPLNKSLNLSQVIEYSKEGTNVAAYRFMLTSAINNTPYKPYLVGNNEYDSLLTQERSIAFDEKSLEFIKQASNGELSVHEDVYGMADKEFVASSAKSANQLRQEDLDPSSEEYRLNAYLNEVKSGKRQFSFDDPENPNPGAFKHDGSGFIRDISPNEFQARVLDNIADELRKYGADVKDEDVLIDELGVVKFKVKIPLIDRTTKEPVYSGQDYQRYDELTKDFDRFENVNGYAVDKKNHSVYVNRNSKREGIRYQEIEGTFGQIFAPQRDGLVTTKYNRYDEFSQDLGQFVYQPKYVGSYNMPDRSPNGDWDREALRRELHSGLGHNERLRAKSYDSIVRREVSQAVHSLVSTSSLGNVSEYNSNTILNKTLHGETYGTRVETHKLFEPVTELGQRVKETELRAIRLEDGIGLATGTTALIPYMTAFQKTYDTMKKNGELTDPNNEEECYLDVVCKMKDPAVIYGGHSYANLSHESEMLYFSDNMTGQGGMFGKLRYLIDGVKVDESGVVTPNAFFDENGDYILDNDGKIVGFGSGTPIENDKRLDTLGKNPADRKQPSVEQTIKAQHNLSDVRIAALAAGGATMEDGCLISQAFAEKYKVFDEVDENNKPIYRPISPGDKISDTAGNKATISGVISPDRDLSEASSKGLLDTVLLFKSNPDLEVVMTGSSQLSRNNGGTGYTYLNNESSDKMSFERMLPNGNGEFVPTGEVVQTNATINHGDLIITNQTVGHKVTLYDDSSSGRKLSLLLNNSNNAKGATRIANLHHLEEDKLRTFRSFLLSTGMDITVDGFSTANYNAVANETSLVEYGIPDSELEKLVPAYTGVFGTQKFKDAYKDRVIELDANNNLKQSDIEFLSEYKDMLERKSLIVSNEDMWNENRYNAGSDALLQFPDGGVLQLNNNIKIKDLSGVESDKIYILPEKLRHNIESLDGSTNTSDFNIGYQNLGMKLAQHEMLVRASKELGLAGHINEKTSMEDRVKIEQTQQKINERFAELLNIQSSYDRVANEAQRISVGKESPKYAYFRNNVLGGYSRDTVTSQLSSNPSLSLDTIEISPEIAKSLGYVTGENGFAHIEGHPDWDRIHVHRDPVWREQGALGFRVVISDEIKSCRISPISAALMDADFDGDNVGLFAVKDDEGQRELREVMSLDQYMLDNNQYENLLNLNAELVDIAVNVDNEYSVTLENGNVLVGRLSDNEFKKAVMGSVLKDYQKDDWFDADGNVLDEAVESLNAKQFIDVMANHEIKTHYNNNDFVGARQKMDEIVQLSRGFNVERDLSGEVVISEGDVSMYENDGFDYTSPETLRKSLERYVDEGAKGSHKAIDGLFNYIEKPLFSEIKALGEKQVVDGVFYPEVQKAYKEKSNIVRDSASREAIANKIKSDMTGVPGSMQQKLTAVLNNSPEELHAASAIGQGATQKILSIKRDVVGAAFTSEILQRVLSKVYRGELPKDEYPLFALVGPQSEGLLGDDPAFVSLRSKNLLNTQVTDSKGNRTAFSDLKTSASSLSDSDLKLLASTVNMSLDLSNEKQKNGFIETLDKAKTPYLSDELVDLLKSRLADSRGVTVDKIQFPANQEDYNKPVELQSDEFVELLTILYNDPKLGLDLDVDKSNFKLLADKLVDPATGNIRSIDDYIENNATLFSGLNMNGSKQIYNLDDKSKGQLFGAENSMIRDMYFAGYSDEELSNQLSLSKDAQAFVPVNQYELTTDQINMFSSFNTELSSDIVDDKKLNLENNHFEKIFSSVRDRSGIVYDTKDDTTQDNELKSILFGNYVAPCVVDGVKCDTVSEQITRRLVVKARKDIDISDKTLQTLKENEGFGIKAVCEEYKIKTGQPLVSSQDKFDFWKDSFVLQMKTHSDVAKRIVDSVQENSEILNLSVESDAIKASVDEYKAFKQTKQKNYNTSKSKETVKNDRLSKDSKSKEVKESMKSTNKVKSDTQIKTEPYSQRNEILLGKAWSPINMNYVDNDKQLKLRLSGGTVNGVVADALLQTAQLKTNNTISKEIVDLINKSNTDAKDSDTNLRDGISALRKEYSDKTNKDILSEVNMTKLLGNAYYTQFCGNQSFVDSVKTVQSLDDVDNSRQQIIKNVLAFYDKEKSKQSVKSTGTSPSVSNQKVVNTIER